MVRKLDAVAEIVTVTASLERARLICALLRQEGILARSPQAVLHLADRLTESLTLTPQSR